MRATILAINRIMILIYLRSLFCLQISKNRVEFLLIISKHYIFSSECREIECRSYSSFDLYRFYDQMLFP